MRHRVAGYHTEGSDDRIAHQAADTTRQLRTMLRTCRLRLGRWRPIMPGDRMDACEWYGGTDLEPTGIAHIRNRGGRVVGYAYRHGGHVVRRTRRDRAEARRIIAESIAIMKRWNAAIDRDRLPGQDIPREETCDTE